MKNGKIITFIMSIMLLIFLNGCSTINEESIQEIPLDNTDFNTRILSTENRDKLPNTTSGGISLGLYGADGQIEKEVNFNLEENQSIEKLISLGNLIDEDRTYKVLLFVDFQQEKFSVDNREPKNDFTFHLGAGESIEIPFKIAPLKKGLHDILFVIAKYPDNKSLDNNFRKNTDLNNLLFLRFSAVVGEDETINNIQFNKYGEYEKDDILDGLFVSKEDNYQRWLKQELSEKENLNYFTKIGNNSGQKKSYALISLFDWEQHNIIDDEKVTFYDLENNEVMTLKSSLLINKKKGIYDLTPILVHNPFQKLNMNNREVETGIRIGVKVK